ncbi:MAG: hypothetical protein ABF308_04375 [Phaeobacter gallaeciensis]|jgi:hypothetical protein
MDPTDKEGPDFGTDEQCAPDLTGHRFPIAVRVADMPDDLGKLLAMGLEEHFRGG